MTNVGDNHALLQQYCSMLNFATGAWRTTGILDPILQLAKEYMAQDYLKANDSHLAPVIKF